MKTVVLLAALAVGGALRLPAAWQYVTYDEQDNMRRNYHGFLDFINVRFGMAVQKTLGAHNHTRRTKSALRAVFLKPTVLQGVQHIVFF